MNQDEKSAILSTGSEFCCAACYKTFAQENDFKEHLKEHPNTAKPERLFLFLTYDGKVKPLNDKHALVFGIENRKNFKEYLGFIETNDFSILEKSVEDIRAMDLPKIMPLETRKTVFFRGREMSYGVMNRIQKGY